MVITITVSRRENRGLKRTIVGRRYKIEKQIKYVPYIHRYLHYLPILFRISVQIFILSIID